MKGFLIDENLPDADRFPAELTKVHARELGPMAADSQLWEHARNQHLVIVTKDSDFSDRILVSTPPPWVVHLRTGNMTRRQFADFIARVWPQVEALLPTHRLIRVFPDRIEAIRS